MPVSGNHPELGPLLWIFGLSLMVVGPVRSLCAESADPLAQQFLTERPRWQEYEKFLERLQGKASCTWTRDESLYQRHWSLFRQNDECKLVERQFFDDTILASSKGYVWAYNRRYGFSLHRKNPESPWVVEQLLNDMSAARGEVNGALAELEALIGLRFFRLEDLVREPTFRVIHAKGVTHGGTQMVEIEFENLHALRPEKGKELCPIQAGSLMLDPNHAWCLSAADIRYLYNPGEGKGHLEATYAISSLGSRFRCMWLML